MIIVDKWMVAMLTRDSEKWVVKVCVYMIVLYDRAPLALIVVSHYLLVRWLHTRRVYQGTFVCLWGFLFLLLEMNYFCKHIWNNHHLHLELSRHFGNCISLLAIVLGDKKLILTQIAKFKCLVRFLYLCCLRLKTSDDSWLDYLMFMRIVHLFVD